jgi:hypothetical protein
MKLSKIVLAVGATLFASQVFAAGLTTSELISAQKTWISGASAPTRVIYEGWVEGCDAGTNTIYSSQTGTAVVPGSLGNFVAYSCKRGGVSSVLFHTVDGGSLNAYAPHTVGTKLGRVSLSAIIAAVTAASTPTLNYVDSSNPLNNAGVYKGVAAVGVAVSSTPTANTIVNGTTKDINGVVIPAGNTLLSTNAYNANKVATDAANSAPQLPVGGFSDVEAALWPSAIGGGDVSSAGTEGQANIGQVFGVAVSTNLYRALQLAQGFTAAQITADIDFSPALAPNISSEQYASIIQQGGSYQTDWSPILGSAGIGKKVILARRVETSGTQASSNAFFLKNPCTNAVSGNLNPAVAADSSANFEVFEGSGTSDVKKRLSLANVQGDYAIGVMSVENDWNLETNVVQTVAAPGSHEYRWLKLDGVHPEAGDVTGTGATLNRGNARLQAVNGQYPFHMETRTFIANGLTGFNNSIVTAIAGKLAAPTNAAACTTLPRGLTLNPLGGSSCTNGVQVHKGTTLGNSCAPISLFF